VSIDGAEVIVAVAVAQKKKKEEEVFFECACLVKNDQSSLLRDDPFLTKLFYQRRLQNPSLNRSTFAFIKTSSCTVYMIGAGIEV
jgi:hypothetical protein